MSDADLVRFAALDRMADAELYMTAEESAEWQRLMRQIQDEEDAQAGPAADDSEIPY